MNRRLEKVFVLVCALQILTGICLAQRERVAASLDKYTWQTGDTVWFKSFVFQGDYPSFVSTILYSQVYDQQGKIVTQGRFPIVRGLSVGQVVIPDTLTTGTYFFTVFTLQQLGFDSSNVFALPVVVYNKEKPGRANHRSIIAATFPFTYQSVGNMRWISGVYRDSLLIHVMVDVIKDSLSLHISKMRNKDSLTRADLVFTKSNSTGYVSFPIDPAKEREQIFLEIDSTVASRHVLEMKRINRAIQVDLDTLDMSPYGYNSWKVLFPDSGVYFASISITDADRSIDPPITVDTLRGTYSDVYGLRPERLDTSFITFTGKATRELGKAIQAPTTRDVVIQGVKDSRYVFREVVRLGDKGAFRLDSMLIFGPLDLQYQFNSRYDYKDIKLTLTPLKTPELSLPFLDGWKEDSSLVTADTFQTKEEIERNDRRHFKTLAPVTVSAWKDPKVELDREYATGSFAEPTGQSFDLRTDSSPYNRDIQSYILYKIMRLKYDYILDSIVDLQGHPVRFFLNQIETPFYNLKGIPFEQIAYIKALESDFLSTRPPDAKLVMPTEPPKTVLLPPMYPKPGESQGKQPGKDLKIPEWKTAFNVCIYTRKGKDFRTLPGSIPPIHVNGYTPFIPFAPGRVTLYWNPYVAGNVAAVHFTNNDHAHRFRISIQGITYRGEVIHLEKVVEH